MKKTLFPFLTLILMTLAACGGQAGSTSIPISPTLMPAPPDDAYVSTNCVPIALSRPTNIQLAGNAILGDYKTAASILLNLADGSRTPLTSADEGVSKILVSPDRKTMAYELAGTGTTWNLVISDAKGTRTNVIPWKQGFFDTGYWLNNQQILILTSPPFEVFNPSNNQQQTFDYTDFPGYYLNTTENRYVGFNPDLSRAVYKNSDGNISLLDLGSKKILGEVLNPMAPFPIADWTLDGSQVAVVGNATANTQSPRKGDDIFSISQSGQVNQLTHLADHYGQYLTISSTGISWSPDSRYIAFWLIYAAPQWQLAVYDTVSQKTTNFCISNNTNSHLSFRPLPAPIWSPDSKQIMVENRYNQTDNHVVILDVTQKTAFQVAEDMYPLGWVVSTNP